MYKSVTINEVSYNGEHALALGKDEWTSDVDVLSHFNGDKAKASAAFDEIEKQLKERKADEDKATAVDSNAEKQRADAQKKLEARKNKQAAAPLVAK